MPNVTIERKITKEPVRSETYFVVDSEGNDQTVEFGAGKATLNLSRGEAALVIGFVGNVGSKVSFRIQTPNHKHSRSASIRRGTSILTARYFDV
ncbi:MAG: hypothetical protein ABJO36_01255 [Litorimonas sp.]